MRVDLKTHSVGCLKINWVDKYDIHDNRPGWLDPIWAKSKGSTFLVSSKYTQYEFLKKAYESIYTPTGDYIIKITPSGKYFEIRIFEKGDRIPTQKHLIEIIVVPPTSKVREKFL